MSVPANIIEIRKLDGTNLWFWIITYGMMVRVFWQDWGISQ